ncbi:uncharacterized protein Z520_03065 [Fonsecaea multimorphosa CBS 102226]|uniref:Transcription factor domain-containing protein n=1 Tax=Fonsecaea multimorphosa CBS 102226 TaxID=1442371 RepID=A0A0D2K6N0_9EURO|nr:uncharacterized protein Z520_03065 [Fonsecaea multimorphosa CBS 102226]KIY01513.1 hypothetical protein Z520_03065 [Fonsecaea multimorphosa CBS 102226]OAL28273.1 hypothetical protein AYO22_02979 [Fonsecaea multimorphosa]
MRQTQPEPAGWEDSVTVRAQSGLPKGRGGSEHDTNQDDQDEQDDRDESQYGRQDTVTSSTTGSQPAVTPRKPLVKRGKDRKPRTVTSKKTVARKAERDEALAVVNYSQSPSLLLEPDADEPYPLLPSALPNGLVKRHLHNLPDVLAKLVSKAALTGKYGRSFASNVMASLSQHPAQLHAMIFAVMVHDRIQQGISNPTATELMVGTEAIRHLNTEISDPDPKRALSDSNIWAVLVLAYSGREDRIRSGPSYPRQSFLRELQSIHIYLKMEIVIEHVLGLIKMMDLLGNLHKIKTPGIAPIVSWCGIMGACRSIGRPIFPFISHTATFVRGDGRLSITNHERDAVAADLGTLGTGFWQVWSPKPSAPSYLDDLLTVIRDICDFTVVVENHASGRWMPRTSPEIIDQRNFVQHKLMSLWSAEELLTARDVAVDDLQYETCRLACIIYSFIVVFPVPPVVGPFETLIDRIKRALQATEWKNFDPPRLRLHLWILAMGAIGSIGLPDRPWFLLRIMEVLDEFDIKGWKDLKVLLQSFLWHPRTSDPDGLDIWKAVQHGLDVLDEL